MRLTFLFVAGLALAGCGSSPVAPGQPPPGPPLFSTGRYTVIITGFDFSSTPELPACAGPIGVPRSGKVVHVELQVVKEGSEWVGRGTSAGADIELRFRDGGEAQFGRRAFSGTIRGRARDFGLPGLLEPQDVSVVIGDAATLTGETAFSRIFSTLIGRAQGDFQFFDSAGRGGSCGVVGIHINAPSN